jgi:hypothetical protein
MPGVFASAHLEEGRKGVCPGLRRPSGTAFSLERTSLFGTLIRRER